MLLRQTRSIPIEKRDHERRNYTPLSCGIPDVPCGCARSLQGSARCRIQSPQSTRLDKSARIDAQRYASGPTSGQPDPFGEQVVPISEIRRFSTDLPDVHRVKTQGAVTAKRDQCRLPHLFEAGQSPFAKRRQCS